MREIPSIADLIATPERWCQGPPAKDASGCFADTRSETAFAWCLLGAIDRLFGFHTRRGELAQQCLNQATRQLTSFGGAILFNEHPQTIHADVLRVARRADELIRERLGAAP